MCDVAQTLEPARPGCESALPESRCRVVVAGPMVPVRMAAAVVVLAAEMAVVAAWLAATVKAPVI